jgi:hypothetical protein
LATPFVAALGTESDGARTAGDSDSDGTPVLEGLTAPMVGALAELAGGWPVAQTRQQLQKGYHEDGG